uniref:Uncharacterized protein n=1 Tax=Oryza meridionalis TaxID=40149 RepID=A0A0E0ERK2_9ORYZ
MLLTDDDPSCADWWCGFGQGIAGESLAEPFGWLTPATPFGVVPLLGGVHTPFLSLPYSPGENLASVPNERWRRSTSHPPWGHRFGETSSCKDIVIGGETLAAAAAPPPPSSVLRRRRSSSPAKPGDALGWWRRGHPPRLHLALARAWRRWWQDSEVVVTGTARRRRRVGRGGGAPRCRLSAAPATGDGVARSGLPAWPG